MSITAASTPLTLTSGNGKSKALTIAPFSDRDHDELHEWVRSRIIQQAEEAAQALTPARADVVIQSAIRCALPVRWFDKTGASVIGSVDGNTRLLWQSAKRDHPNVTFEELRPYMLIPENVNALTVAIERVNAGPEEDDGPKKN